MSVDEDRKRRLCHGADSVRRGNDLSAAELSRTQGVESPELRVESPISRKEENPTSSASSPLSDITNRVFSGGFPFVFFVSMADVASLGNVVQLYELAQESERFAGT